MVSSWSEYKCHEDISSKKPTYFSFKKEATKISGYSYLKKRQSLCTRRRKLEYIITKSGRDKRQWKAKGDVLANLVWRTFESEMVGSR